VYFDTTSSTIYYSLNGVIWTVTNSAFPSATPIGVINGQLYMFDGTLFYASSDYGASFATWTASGLDLTPGSQTLVSVFILFNQKLFAYLGNNNDDAPGRGVYSSADFGHSFTFLGQNVVLDGTPMSAYNFLTVNNNNDTGMSVQFNGSAWYFSGNLIF